MQKLVREYLDEFDKRQRKNRKVHIAAILLVVIVVGSVAGVLMQYGTAMTGKAKCGLEEHTHNEKCYENVLVCEITEGEGHIHTAECNYPQELACGKEEMEGHTHTEECRLPEELVCDQEESEEHTHTAECYQVPEGYACGLEESEGHQHTEACYQTPEGYACGLEEGTGHVHIAECYKRELTCIKAEHTHTDVCYTDAAADVEDSSVWDAQYAAVEWKNIWGEDLVTAAQMQLGYQESDDNYIVAADGNRKGYTRYGQFAGNAYIDWDGAFVNFCIHYAGLEESNFFPKESDTAKWCEEFRKVREENSAYLTASANYEPAAGDLIFFQREGEETENQMGIVSSYDKETATVWVIEGNSANGVRENEYNITDSHIISYLNMGELEESYKAPEEEIIENTETEEAEEEESTEESEEPEEARVMTVEGPDYTVTVSFTSKAQIPEDAVLEVTEIEPGSDAYQEYYRQSLQAMGAEEISFARYFDVTFLVDGEEIEPSAPVDVKICYTDSIEIEEDASGGAVHFSKDGTEVLNAGVDEEENSFTFTQGSFSVVGTIVAKGIGSYYYKGGVPEDLDGKTFLLETVRDADHIFLTGNEQESSKGIKGLAGSKTEDLTSVEEPKAENLWTFHKTDETIYQIQNAASGKYLKINGANVTLEEEAFDLTVETIDDTITIRNEKYFLAADENACILAESKTKSELESYHKFRLFGAGTDYTLTAEGTDYRITLNLSALEGLMDDVEFTADEITGETADIYSEKAQEALGFEEVGFQRFFHLGFSKEIPEDLVHISSVDIQYKDNAEGFDITGAGGVVQFKESQDLISGAAEAENTDDTDNAEDAGVSVQADEIQADDIQEEVVSAAIDGRENTISADISELSDIGTVWTASTGDLYYQKSINSIDDLDGKDFLIANVLTGGTSRIMGSAWKSTQSMNGLWGYVFAGGAVVNRSTDMELWHFEKQEDDTFYITQSGVTTDNRYLNIENVSTDKAGVSIGAAQKLTVNVNNANGKIEIMLVRSNPANKPHMYVNSYANGADGGFAGWYGDNDSGSLLTLYEKNDKELDLPLNIENIYEGLKRNPISEYVTEETEPQLSNTTTIHLKGKDLYVDFTDKDAWKAVGKEKRYELVKAQIVNKTNNNIIGNIDHIYISNDAQYKLVFYDGNTFRGTYEPDQVKIQNVYRAYKNGPLEEEPTISTKDKISIRMIDYGSRQFTGWGWMHTNKEVKQGILKPYVEAKSGYPAFTLGEGEETPAGENGNSIFNSSLEDGTKSLAPYFANATEADYLFREDKFINGEYYEYRSTENGASYDEGEGRFTVYKQLTGTKDLEANTEDHIKLVSKGQFLPYNTFDKERKIADMKNMYTAQNAELSQDDEYYGKDLYLPDEESVNYHFGMEIGTEFYQMKDGKVGINPMIYEFSGDDDLWVYIDGVLILDMGGCHDARSGYINFSTGEVFIQQIENKGVETSKTLHELFVDARDAAVENGEDQTVIDDLNEKLKASNWKTVNGKEIFADYSKHDFKMWYMERGEGASNLEVRFNLPVIPQGDVQIEKRLANTDQGSYTNEKFDFQVYLQPLEDNWNSRANEEYKEVDKEDYKLLNKALYEEGRTNVKVYVVQPDGRRERIEDLPDDGIFQLYPGERLDLEGLKKNRKYYVREMNMDYNRFSGINLDQIILDENGNETPETKRVPLDPNTDHADTDIKKVAERVYILINNECSDANRNALIIKKVMSQGSGDNNGDTYTFRVLLEGPNGVMKPYEGNYYLNVQPDEITDTTEVYKTETPGIISGIKPDDWIVIKDILADTKFLVEEINLGPQYDNPIYVLEYQQRDTNSSAVTPTAPSVTSASPYARATGMASQEVTGVIQEGADAKVTVQNTRYDEVTWHIIKQSSTEGGPFVEAVFKLTSSDGKGNTYYGKSSVKDGIITWYSDEECTQTHQIGTKNLAVGSYTFTEVDTSPGYLISKESWDIEIQEHSIVTITGPNNIDVKENIIAGTNGEDDITDYIYTFYNTPAYELPKAGGRGIYWYMIGGILLMLGGALILYKNKCREVLAR